MGIKFANFARSTLAVGIGAGDVSITVATGTGTRFPTLAVGDYFYATLENAALAREIVKVTARSTDVLTVVRAQDNTTALSWVVGDTISLRLNAAAMADTVGNVVLKTSDTGAAVLPSGTTGERPGSPTTGNLRYNSSTGQFEGYGAAGWGSIGGGAVANETLLETKHTISTNYTLTTGASAVTVGPLSVATGQSLTVPTGEAVVALSTTGTPAADNVTPITTGTQTVYGNKTFVGQITFTGGVAWNASATPSMVRVQNASGYGSTNTVIKRYSNVLENQGSDVTYADSATLGASFTINVSGVYAMSIVMNGPANAQLGISVNSTQLTTAIGSITAANRIGTAQVYAASATAAFSNTMYLAAGSVVRPHCDASATGGAAVEQFTITRVA